MSRKKRRKKYKVNKPRLFISITVIFFILLLIIGVSFSVYSIYQIARELPDLEKKAGYQPAQTTKLYSSNGTFIADFHAEENRVVVPLEKIPLHLRNAVISIEDERFYQHHGVDFRAILRALVENLKKGGIAEGASTITQQYVRSIYITKEKTYKRKIKEAILALQIESLYSKDKILEKYLNIYYFGSGAYGVEAAAQTFFRKSATKLTLAESALLAGVMRSPSGYSPYKNIEKSKKRRDLVLGKMEELDYITKEEKEKALDEEIKVNELKEERWPAPYFVQYVKQFLSSRFGEETVFKGGLRVFTTLDLNLQFHAETAVFSTLDEPDDPSSALIAIEPKTGYIKAMVGGKDFVQQKFNYAVQGRRQTGSSFKTFTLVAAIEKGISTNKTYSGSPTTIKYPGGVWKVRNYGGGSYGTISLKTATIKSVNAVFARLVMDVGPENVVEISKKMGITTELDPVPSITLGSQEVSPLEMASAYATIANEGIYIEPSAVLRITDASGKLIYENKSKKTQAISPISAYLTTEILESVIKYGTGTRAKIGRPAAGKTGTNQDYRDAWFVGYTPNLACAVWIGFPNAQISMKNIHGFSRVSGGSLPAMIWSKFMKPAHENLEVADFKTPETGITRSRICVESGLRANRYCPNTSLGIFPKGSSPTKYCNIHKGIVVPDVIGKTATDASNIILEEKLSIEKAEQVNSEVPAGQVINQDPTGGTKVKEGSLVKIYVSLGSSVENKPDAQFTYEPTIPEEDELVKFNASGSGDSDGSIVLYEWNFGDGTSLSGGVASITHRFLEPGFYNVILKVVDNNGNEDTASTSIQVDPD
ncbi:MAG: PBP1A family penicillin-binding protein [Actinomycetia bacterium]|nr:PBP1A family penicillin-binding protein [Actinomycetes bacterium]